MATIPYRAIAESTYDWETWIDAEGRAVWVNPAVERLTGHSPAACLAMAGFPLPIVHAEDRGRIATILESAARGTTGNDVELRVLHADGSVRWAAISWQPLHVARGETRGFRTSVRDIDARKQVEERVREAERRATRLARDQSELLATLSHELRSPLHCISGFGELIERLDLDDTTRGYVAIVREQSDAALRLVEDLLHFVSLAESKVTLRPIAADLAGLVAREIEATTPRVRPGVRIVLGLEPSSAGAFTFDPDRVRQVIANLLANAARFTEQGTIDVSLRQEDADVVVEVRDTGIGMSEALLAHVKDPFVKGESTVSSRGGAGLGLAIVERLVVAMGGSLELASKEAQGTRATVRLPLERAAEPSRAEERVVPPLDAARLAGLRVLLVDDSEPARALLSAMFRTSGVEPDTASSGREAIVRAGAVAYDLVVLDYHMPDLDGVATAGRLRGLHAQDPVLVLLTANVLAEAFADPSRHGMDLVLAKPLRLAQVTSLVRQVLDASLTAADFGPVASAPTEDGVDHDVAIELCAVRAEDGTTLLARTLPRVDAELSRVLALVRELASRRAHASADLMRALHGAKGLVASVGAATAAASAAELEAALGRDEDAEATIARIDAVERAFARARGALEALSRA